MSIRLTDEQRLDWLRLIRTDGIGPRTFRGLVNRFGGAAAALDALSEVSAKAGRPTLRPVTRAEAEREVERAARLGARFVALGEADYPRALQAIDTAPPLMALRGSADLLRLPVLAVVGSRNASAAGLAFTERLCRSLGESGFAIASGLARGIDTRAHKAALASGTIAVLAGGHDRIYPAENEPLAARIIEEGGAILSEMPIGWEPRGRDFPRRNRIVSGLAHGVIVVEAARKSGSLITARFALEQGREVFAVPGSPLDPRAEGTNDLIRDGATLCASPEHVVEVIGPVIQSGAAPGARAEEPTGSLYRELEPLWDEFDIDARPPLWSGEDEATEEPLGVPNETAVVLSLLGPAPIAADELARQAGLPIRTVQLLLFDLELAGRLERHGANAVSLVPR